MGNYRDGYLNQGDPTGATVLTVMLSADNQTVDASGYSFIKLSSDNTTAANRTFILANSTLLGQDLTIVFESGASTTAQLANSGTCKLSAAWEPIQYQSLVVQWDGSYWIEKARNNVTLPGSTALVSAHIFVGNGSNLAADVAVSGDITLSNAGVVAIASDVIVNADVKTDAAIAFSKLATLTSGNVLVGSVGNVATSVAMGGDVTIIAAGTTAIGANKVTVAMQNAAVMKEATGTISQAQMQALSTPVVLVAAAGAGTVHIVDEIELLHTYAVAAYATGSDVSIEYETSGDNIVLIVDSFFTAGASANTVIKPSTYNLDGSTGSASGFDVTANANKAVQVTASNFTNGDVANIFKYRVRYHTVTLLT